MWRGFAVTAAVATVVSGCGGAATPPPPASTPLFAVGSRAPERPPVALPPRIAPWQCRPGAIDGDFDGARAWKETCPVSSPITSEAGICAEPGCMRPCRRVDGLGAHHYVYDAAGRLLGAWRMGREPFAEVRLIWDEERLVSVVYEHAYEELSYIDDKLWHVQMQTSDLSRSTEYTYDEQGRVIEERERQQGDGRDVVRVFEWSKKRIAAQHDRGEWQYDEKRETLVARPGNETWTYEYDADGFLGCRVSGDNRHCYVYDEHHRVSEVGGRRFEYDERGRLSASSWRMEGREQPITVRWDYECGAQPDVSALFEPTPRFEIEPCMDQCTETLVRYWGSEASGASIATRCRASCERVGDPSTRSTPFVFRPAPAHAP
jgi:YD repeat-containing protein